MQQLRSIVRLPAIDNDGARSESRRTSAAGSSAEAAARASGHAWPSSRVTDDHEQQSGGRLELQLFFTGQQAPVLEASL